MPAISFGRHLGEEFAGRAAGLLHGRGEILALRGRDRLELADVEVDLLGESLRSRRGLSILISHLHGRAR